MNLTSQQIYEIVWGKSTPEQNYPRCPYPRKRIGAKA